MTDLLTYQTGSGGDLVLRGNDLVGVNGYENSTYLSMFGGADWWGNFMVPDANKFQSKTEDILKITPLSSAGRVIIENTIKRDLAFLTNIPNTTFTDHIHIIQHHPFRSGSGV